MTYIYLASAYSHPAAGVRFGRYAKTALCCARLYSKGVTVFSPIVHCHHLSSRHDLPHDADFWRVHNMRMLNAASALWVLDEHGWQESDGVTEEIAVAFTQGLDVKLVNIDGEVRDYVAPAVGFDPDDRCAPAVQEEDDG